MSATADPYQDDTILVSKKMIPRLYQDPPLSWYHLGIILPGRTFIGAAAADGTITPGAAGIHCRCCYQRYHRRCCRVRCHRRCCCRRYHWCAAIATLATRGIVAAAVGRGAIAAAVAAGRIIGAAVARGIVPSPVGLMCRIAGDAAAAAIPGAAAVAADDAAAAATILVYLGMRAVGIPRYTKWRFPTKLVYLGISWYILVGRSGIPSWYDLGMILVRFPTKMVSSW